MSYLHVTIKTNNSNDWICVFKDLSESDLKKSLVTPYKLGKAIYYDGNILAPNEISQIKINKTEKAHSVELKIVQHKSQRDIQESNNSSAGITLISLGHGYHDHEINECGSEVTNKYISTGPGSGTFSSYVGDVIKHPWVVRVVGGLVFIAVATYFGLK
tara:strand:+ start:18 stop:494 length:477 start_codon:yes stop_codon:yes gene_type:complete